MRKKELLLSFLLITLGTNSENSSKINIKTNLKKAAVETFIENEVPKTFTGNEKISLGARGGTNLLSLGLSLLGSKVSKYSPNIILNYNVTRGDISFSLDNWKIFGGTDFSGVIAGNLDGSNEKYSSNFKGRLGVKSGINLSENWELSTITTPELLLEKVILPVKASVAGVKINEEISLREQVAKKIEPILFKTAKDIDEKVRDIDLKTLINNYWITLKEPVLLDKDLDIWLLIRPKIAYRGELSSDDKNISLTSGIEGAVTLFVGRPESFPNLGTLPMLKPTTQDISKFNLNIPVVVKYQNLEAVLNKNFTEKIFDIFSGVTAESKKIFLQGDNRELKLKTDFSLKIFNLLILNGVLTAKGTPEIYENRELHMKDFDFEIESDSFILKTIDKFFHKKIQETVKKNYLTINFEKDLTGAKTLLLEKIAKLKINEKVSVENSVDELKITNIDIREREIVIHTNLVGASILEISSM